MNILITLCARGGSKGIPGKNIRKLNGIPLIGFSIQTANKFKSAFENAEVDIALSTDSTEIKNVAAELGLYTAYKRPEALATDSAGKLPAIIHLKEYEEGFNNKKYDFLIDLDVSSPLRTVEDLIVALEIMRQDTAALNLFSVNVANRNPYFNMVEASEDGYYRLCKKLEGDVLSRQAAPAVYELNASFYIYTKAFFDQKCTSVISERSLVYKMPHICFDLDHEYDFDFMSFLIAENKLPFSL